MGQWGECENGEWGSDSAECRRDGIALVASTALPALTASFLPFPPFYRPESPNSALNFAAWSGWRSESYSATRSRRAFWSQLAAGSGCLDTI